ncbi:MAG: hypothetical protein ACQESH_04885 [Campylobacterota bacterium]
MEMLIVCHFDKSLKYSYNLENSKKGVDMQVKNAVFEKVLANNDLSKKDFASYAKIPYNTVAGWKKNGVVPAYAMVILKDMVFRKKLDADVAKELKKQPVAQTKVSGLLTADEERRLKSVFWGTNYRLDEIAVAVREKNQKIMEKIEQNLPLSLQKRIMGKLSDA